MRDTHFLAVTFAVSIFLACAVSDPVSNEVEWRSLGNPYNRDLFFKFMKSYIMGRGMHGIAPGRKDKVGNHRRRADSAFDSFQQNLNANRV